MRTVEVLVTVRPVESRSLVVGLEVCLSVAAIDRGALGLPDIHSSYAQS